MNGMTNWLTQPYPFDGTWRDSIKSAIYGGVFVFLFLLIFQPFGSALPKGMFWRGALVFGYFGLVTAAVLLSLGLVMRLLPSFFKEEDWVIWKEVLANIVTVMMIGLGNMFLAMSIFDHPLSLPVFLSWQKVTFMVGIFPILFTAYSKQQVLQKRYFTGAENLNNKIADHPKGSPEKSPSLTLQGDNQNETLALAPSALLYLEASDNYVRVFYHENGTLENSMLRSTLKKMEAQLNGHPQFFRCHRTFLVNLDKVEHVSGNAQGYKLHLEKCRTLVPVSRSLNEEIMERFK